MFNDNNGLTMPMLFGDGPRGDGLGFLDKQRMKAVPTLPRNIRVHALGLTQAPAPSKGQDDAVENGPAATDASPTRALRILTPRQMALLSEYPALLLDNKVAESSATLPITVFDARALAVLGPDPSLTCILSTTEAPLWHEAGIYLPATREVLVTSNRHGDGVKISSIAFSPTTTPSPPTRPDSPDYSDCGSSCSSCTANTDWAGTANTDWAITANTDWTSTELPDVAASVPMANGGTNFGPDDVLLCAQGTHTARAGLVRLRRDASAPSGWAAEYVLDHYRGRPFNSPNDVVVTRRCGSTSAHGGRRLLVWFTDPAYGHEQGFRPRPRLPPLVYCWDPATGAVRVVADGFGHPNGIAFSPAEDRCYITDTDMAAGDGSCDECRVATIYKMDVVDAGDGNPTLTGRTVFAMADTGIPDGIKCDVHGNVYAGCGDGLNVWSPGGTLLFKVLIPGGVANFCFCGDGQLMLFNETKTWLLKLDEGHRGTLLEGLRLDSHQDQVS